MEDYLHLTAGFLGLTVDFQNSTASLKRGYLDLMAGFQDLTVVWKGDYLHLRGDCLNSRVADLEGCSQRSLLDLKVDYQGGSRVLCQKAPEVLQPPLAMMVPVHSRHWDQQ